MIDLAARLSYRRLLRRLAAGGDRAAAEDALAAAFAAALQAWPDRGVPDDPDAWLYVAARRRLLDEARRRRTTLPWPVAMPDNDAQDRLPDRRLALLFACVHPAVPVEMQAPLMLQVVLGLDAARIGSCFLVSPATMGQQLVRAKAAIRSAGAKLAWPEPEEWPARAEAVLDAIYAAFGTGWDDFGTDTGGRDLAEEALWLAHVAAALLPGDPEAAGLLALLLHCEARRAARRDPADGFVPLDAQDPARWDWGLIERAETVLRQAAATGRPGRFQLEAAIQSAHVGRRTTGVPGWHEVALLYEGLVRISASLGARVGHAAALGEAIGPAAGLAALDRLEPARMASYQPFWAVRAHLLRRSGDPLAAAAFARAIGLTEEPAVRRYLAGRSTAE